MWKRHLVTLLSQRDVIVDTKLPAPDQSFRKVERSEAYPESIICPRVSTNLHELVERV